MKRFFLLIALCCPLWLFAQQAKENRTIKGQVIDSVTREPLIGATLMIDSDAAEAKDFTPKGTITDVEGKFTLKVPKGLKFIWVSFIGYEKLKLDISKKDEFKILLKPDEKQLEEIVVVSTGYQNIDKRKVTSSITQVKMEDIMRIGVSSVDQLLEGQVAGMTSIPLNGAPGGANKMRIRSTVSLTGSTDPLWVMDGMILEGNDIPANFSDKDNIDELYNTSIAGVNPADIEDITVLKDAAATAIYGARAANGVIVITTKKGRSGKMRINASAAMFVTLEPDLDKLRLMNASEKVDFELNLASIPDLTYRTNYGSVARLLDQANQRDAFLQGGFEGISQDVQQGINALRTTGSDWGDLVYQNAVNQQYNLSVSGGSEHARYYTSIGYYNEEGATIGTQFERINGTLKTDFDLRDNLQLGVSLFVTHSKRKSYITDTDAFTNPSYYTRNVNPYLNVKDENGKYIYDPDIEGLDDEDLKFNLLEERENTEYWLKNLALKPMVTLNYKPWSFLSLSTQFSMQIENSKTEKFADKETYFVRKYRLYSRYSGDNGTAYFMPDGAIIQNWDNDMSQYQWKIQGEFNHVFADRHAVNFMGGFEMRGNKTTTIHTKGFGFNPRSLTTEALVFPEGSAEVSNSRWRQYQKTEIENRYLSYYMTASYTYDYRYTFFGSMRFDGSNLFGVAKKYKYLPLWAVSAAWNINRESFLQDAAWLNDLKLRISYGLQGNVDKNTSPFVVGEWGTTSILPNISEPSINVVSPPNQNLRWEKTKNWNVGVDMAVLNNRISFSIDAYYRKSEDLIGTRALPLENGFSYTSMNWAEASNRGFEFSISTLNVKTKNFRWRMDFNLAHNKSKVDDIQVRDDSWTPSIEGRSIGALFKLKTAGLDETGLPMFFNKAGEKVPYDTFFGLVDEWGIGLPTQTLTNAEYRELFTYAGTTEPKFTGGWINRFYYKNFDLTVSSSFIIDQTMQETPFYNPAETSPGSNYSKRVADIWSPSNTTGKYPKLVSYAMYTEPRSAMYYQWVNGADAGNSYRNYDYWFKDMSYWRISSIRLGYNLPVEVAKRLHLGAARVSFEARNPFVIATSYKGYFDPETWGNVYTQPLPRTFSVGLDLTF